MNPKTNESEVRAVVIKGKLKLNISQGTWDRTFGGDGEDSKKAETILQTLAGMSIASAKRLLDNCKDCLDLLLIDPCE